MDLSSWWSERVEEPALKAHHRYLGPNLAPYRQLKEQPGLRHRDAGGADILRRKNNGTVWIGGILIALASMVPLLNLVAPLFGTAFMVHLFHRVASRKRP